VTAATEILTPAQIEEAIREVANRIAKSVKICSERYRVFLDADRAYEQAFAHAYLEYSGPAHEKKYGAEVATSTEREARDVADAAYRYADRLSKALQDELRAYQSVGASVRAQYSVAGRGDHREDGGRAGRR